LCYADKQNYFDECVVHLWLQEVIANTRKEIRTTRAMIKSKGGFNEKVIITGLAEITKDETKAKDITKVISQKRENKEKIYLKKCKKNVA
jgi:hypothetical protein